MIRGLGEKHMVDTVNKVSRADMRTQGQQSSRLSRGFTMMETLGIVAIIAILLGFGFVAISQVQRSMAQLEVDKTAREIFVAAQNHLSTAQSHRLLTASESSTTSTPASPATPATPATPTTIDKGLQIDGEKSEGIYYFVYPTSEYDINNSNNALGLMLPFGSIDETVRTGGSYIIRYQPETGMVLDVFFAKTSGYGAHTFTASEYANLVQNYSGADKAQARGSYDGGAIIGWYGGENAGEGMFTLKAPTVQVVNGDALLVEVTNPKANDDRLKAYNDSRAERDKAKFQIRLIVEGETSKAMVYYDLTTSTNPAAEHVTVDNSASSTVGTKYTVKLDDVTESKGRFFYATGTPDRSGKIQDATKSFVPGENIKVYAWISSTGQTAAAKSTEATANSIFANGSKDSGTNGYEARIANIRHLSNLSRDVSQFNKDKAKVTATQTTDFSWAEFSPAGKTGNSIRINYGTNYSSPEASEAGTFLPVYADYELAYKGEKHRISGIKVLSSQALASKTDDQKGAGLFASLAEKSSVENLELVDFNVASTIGRAGALAGTLNKTTVTGVLARNSVDNSSNTNDAWQIQGKDAAGGLVGVVDGSSSITNCAGAVYVYATAGPAGGLVGDAGAATIENSYAGGHTYNREQLASETGVGRYNVIASGAAGGLVGSASGTSVKNCYSTASTYGAPSGGLVGSATNGTIENCYAVCKVFGTGVKGAFLGSSSATLTGTNRYVDSVNPNMPAIGDDEDSTAVAYMFQASGDQTAYQVYYNTVNSPRGAVPYDSTLASAYNGKYALPTVSELAGIAADAEGTPVFLLVHYGDWPKMEVEAVNQKS